MPRLTLLRVTLLFVTSIVGLIALWFILPFPQIEDREQYYLLVLQSGARLTTVHPHSWTISSPGLLSPEDYQPKHAGTYSGITFDWQLMQSNGNGNITLRIGHPQYTIFPDLGCEIDLTDMVSGSPRFVKEACYIWAPAGDQDGLSPPYFHYADATLFYHETFNTWQEMYLQMLVPEAGVLQIWKYLPGWSDHNTSDIATIDDDDRRNYLIATFDISSTLRNGQEARLSDVNVSFQNALLPSKTYAVRTLILTILEPLYRSTTWILSAVFYPTFMVIVFACESIILIGTAFWFVAVTCWFVRGRPRPFSQWSKDFYLTKHVARKLFGAPKPRVWGVLGPLDEQITGEQDREIRAKPLSSPIDFFKSSSPLDDFLTTFEITRWMVQPIWQSTTKRKGISSRDYSTTKAALYANKG